AFTGRDKLQIMPLTDTSGCALSSSLTAFSMSSSSSFCSSFRPPSLTNFSSLFIQCSLRPCLDEDCSIRCDRPSSSHSSIILSTRFNLVNSLSSSTPQVRNMDSRLILIPILFVSSLLSLSFAFFAPSDIPSVEDLRLLVENKLTGSESKRRERSAPSPSTAPSEFLPLNELIHAHDRSLVHSPYILSASVMDSLPEPPFYAAAHFGVSLAEEY
ncbi:hypothetical protein PMAYCL1PPCAC_17625, partial [Pristionchus mayeri]